MPGNIETITGSLIFRLQTLDTLAALDLLLVTVAIYLLLLLLRRSQAAFVLRAVLVLAGILLLANLLLPLPTFGIMLSIAALAMLITVPIVLQPELRRWLERFGRQIGFSIGGRESMAGRVIPEITRAVENLSDSKTGALIVIEGSIPLSEIIASGVRLEAEVSAELLQTIFFDKTPLHDGAAVIREDDVVAAGCVLPLSDQVLHGWRRLGTRHRAAVGMSEVSDALTIVVSEETGTVSIAVDGRLRHDLDRAQLHQALSDYYARGVDATDAETWRFWKNWHLPGPHQLLVDLLYLFLAFLLALVATTAVRITEDPIVQATQENVPLRQEGLPDDTTLVGSLPRTVVVEYEAQESRLPSIGVSTFQAAISLTQVTTGTNRVPVEVTTDADRVHVLGAVPDEVDVTVAAIISKTVPVEIRVDDVDALSTAYEISGEASADPQEAVITGPEPSVDQVTTVATSVSVENATSTVREQRNLFAFDENESRVTDVTIDPQEAEVTVLIRRRVNARDVGVRAVTTGSPPEGYWLSGLTVEPASVTVQGNPGTIADLGGFVDTQPVDLSEATGTMVVEVPLELPAEVQAVDSEGNGLTNVSVTAMVAPRSGDLLTQRPVELVNDRGVYTITLEPPDVELLLSGPLPTLNEIDAQPDLVRVIIDALQLSPGESVEIEPEVIAPEGIRKQLVDSSVLVITGE
jgi:diadenylate cyclase